MILLSDFCKASCNKLVIMNFHIKSFLWMRCDGIVYNISLHLSAAENKKGEIKFVKDKNASSFW